MTRLLKNLNVTSVVTLLVGSFLIYMQTRVLAAVDRIPVLEQQILTFKEQLNEMRKELNEERQERKEADNENRQRIRMVEDKQARQP